MAGALVRPEASPGLDSRRSDDASGRELRFFAALLALAILVIAARTQILRIAHLSSHYPLLFYRDVFALALMAWPFRGMFGLAPADPSRRLTAIPGCTLLLLAAPY